MILHQNEKLFKETIRATSQFHSLKEEFIEKDYWITEILCRLSQSKYAKNTIFKGGTSLSKGYNLIERFSEDIDLAYVNEDVTSGNQVKHIIRDIEKEITKSMKEIEIDFITSKGSKYRKSVFEFESLSTMNHDNKLILEINIFTIQNATENKKIQSYINDFLENIGNKTIIETYNLQPFTLNILSKEITLIEKLVSLYRFSFDVNIIESLSTKIRHFYDLYYLTKDQKCIEFIQSDSFKILFQTTFKNDQKLFEIPIGWDVQDIEKSPLTNNFSIIWKELKGRYVRELTALAYRKIPDQSEVEKSFLHLVEKVK